MPAGEGVSTSGWDGTVKTIEATPWVSAGSSFWELSVDSSPGSKADKDYANRDAVPDGTPLNECEYVQVSLRRWSNRQDWASDRTAEGKWRGVRALGLDDIETWMESAPVTWAWISERLGQTPYGLRSAEAWWEAWANQTKPDITPELVVAGRTAEEMKLAERLRAQTGVTTIAGDSVDEVHAFIAATIIRLDDGGQLLSRTAFVDERGGWRQLLENATPLVLVPLDEAFAREVPSGTHHRVLVPTGSLDSGEVHLPPLDAGEVAQLLKASELSDDHADEIGRLARRSLTAMRRRLARTPALHVPFWAAPPAGRAVRAALLAHGWLDSSDADREVLETLSGLDYETFIEGVRRASPRQDPLVAMVGRTWHLVSPVDAWLLLKGELTQDDLGRLKSAVEAVLGERDPSLDLEPTDRWKAAIEGKVLRHSSELRAGIATTLALLGAYGHDVAPSGGSSGTEWANHAVRELLEAANADVTADTWASLSGLLPLLAEAAPDVLAHAVAAGLSGDDPVLARMFRDSKQDDSLFSSHSPHTGLLWALENLAWSPDHLGDAAESLAQLEALDPGGRLANRPSGSLASVFRPWHPDNSATPARRLAVIDGLRARHPQVAWKLLLSMLPKRHGTHFPTHAPRFREWKPARQTVLVSEYVAFIDEVLGRALEDIGSSGERWSQLMHRFPDLPPDARGQVVAKLKSGELQDTLTGEDRVLLWKELHELVGRHREYADADWSLPEADVAALEQVAIELAPSSAVERARPLFADYRPHLPGVPRREHDAFERALAEARAVAIREVDDDVGLDAVRDLSRSAVVKGVVGMALADAAHEKYDAELIPVLGDPEHSDFDLAWSYVGRRIRVESLEIGPYLDETAGLSSDVRARLLLMIPDTRAAWERADGLGQVVSQSFWRNFRPYGLGGDFDAVRYVAQRLMDHGRYAAALDFLNMYRDDKDGKSLETARLIVTGLQKLINIPDDEILLLSEYDFSSMVEVLESHVAELGVDVVGNLEWAYLRALGFEPNVPTLQRLLAEDPDFFVQVLSAMYRAHNADPETVEAESADLQRRATAENAFHLLTDWSWPPGFDGENIDPERLTAWIESAGELLKAADRYEVGMSHLGQVLAHAPADADGHWPPVAVRDLLESMHSEELESGFRVAVINSRGVVSRTLEEGGAQELELVEKYKVDADDAADRWPSTARILRTLVRSYENEARRNEDAAERRRRGLDG